MTQPRQSASDGVTKQLDLLLHCCQECGAPIDQPKTGRPRKTCSERCRQKLSRNARRAGRRREFRDTPRRRRLGGHSSGRDGTGVACGPDAVRCPLCLSPAGELCLDEDGDVAHEVHVQRIDWAERVRARQTGVIPAGLAKSVGYSAPERPV